MPKYQRLTIYILMSLWEVPTGNCELLRKKKRSMRRMGGGRRNYEVVRGKLW